MFLDASAALLQAPGEDVEYGSGGMTEEMCARPPCLSYGFSAALKHGLLRLHWKHAHTPVQHVVAGDLRGTNDLR